jgi:hypothetical protein
MTWAFLAPHGFWPGSKNMQRIRIVYVNGVI